MKKELNVKLIELELDAMKKAVSLHEAIINIIPKFDGKKATARLDTALKAIDKDLSFHMEYNSFIIRMYIAKRSIQTDTHTEYIKDSYITLIHDSIKSGYGDGICQNDVINANILIDRINISKTHLQARIDKVTAELKDIDGIIKEYNDIKEMASKFTDRVSYLTREYFGLNF